MRPIVRLWLTRLLVAAIVVTSGFNGQFALAAHDDHIGVAHVLGTESGIHDHDHASSGWSYVLFCHFEGECQKEPGNATSHVHVSFSGAVAVVPSDVVVAHAAQCSTIGVDQGSRSPLGQFFYPLLRPPRTPV